MTFGVSNYKTTWSKVLSIQPVHFLRLGSPSHSDFHTPVPSANISMFCSSLRQRTDTASLVPMLSSSTEPHLEGTKFSKSISSIQNPAQGCRIQPEVARSCPSSPICVTATDQQDHAPYESSLLKTQTFRPLPHPHAPIPHPRQPEPHPRARISSILSLKLPHRRHRFHPQPTGPHFRPGGPSSFLRTPGPVRPPITLLKRSTYQPRPTNIRLKATLPPLTSPRPSHPLVHQPSPPHSPLRQRPLPTRKRYTAHGHRSTTYRTARTAPARYVFGAAAADERA